MENKIQLTNEERAFFLHLLANSGNGVTDLAGAEYLTCDNYSCFTAKDLIDDVYSFARVGGFMSSLESKGIIVFDEEIDNPLWWITKAGVYLAMDMFKPMAMESIVEEKGFHHYMREAGSTEYRKGRGNFSVSVSIDGFRKPDADNKFWDVGIISHCIFESGDEVLYYAFEGTFEEALTDAKNTLDTWGSAMDFFNRAQEARKEVAR